MLCSRERIARILSRKPADRIGLFEEFWTDTQRAWQGKFDQESTVLLPNHKLDMEKGWAFDFTADVRFTPYVQEETEDTIVLLDGNGATLRQHKQHVSTPEHIDFRCNRPEIWYEEFKPLLQKTVGRIDQNGYNRQAQKSKEEESFLLCGSWNVFQNMVNLCGHETLLMAMVLEPDWVRDMVAVFSSLAINLHESLFLKSGLPDGLFLMEDLGYKLSPFMSPAMFREYIKPAYKEICEFAKSFKLPVLFHSCGFMEPMIPDLIEVGIDCLTAIEVKAGMDIVHLFKKYGDRLSFMGGIDTLALSTNNRTIIEAELQRVIPLLKTGHGYILSSDHSIPDTVTYETYCWFVERGLALGKS